MFFDADNDNDLVITASIRDPIRAKADKIDCVKIDCCMQEI